MSSSAIGIIPTIIIAGGVLAARHYGLLPGNSQAPGALSDPSSLDAFDSNAILIKMHTAMSHLEKLSSGTVENIPYDLNVTVPNPIPASAIGRYGRDAVAVQELRDITNVSAPTVIMRLQLPKPASLHIVCLGGGRNTLDGAFMSLMATMELEPAQLEGDFPDYFRLYCTKGQQVALRQVLDPVIMAFLVDYCTKQDWEVVGNTLYFSQDETQQQTTSTSGVKSNSILQNAEDFITKTTTVFERLYQSQV